MKDFNKDKKKKGARLKVETFPAKGLRNTLHNVSTYI
jgi:hypothetical protein